MFDGLSWVFGFSMFTVILDLHSVFAHCPWALNVVNRLYLCDEDQYSVENHY